MSYPASVNKLYVDMDGVIIDALKRVVDLYNTDFQFNEKWHRIDYNDIQHYDFRECELASFDYLMNYFSQPRFFKSVHPISGSISSLNQLSDFFHEIIVISHGSPSNLESKKIWLNRYLPFVHFVGMSMQESKGSVDMSDGIFIDDLPKNLNESNAKIKILFGDSRIWKDNWSGIRCESWDMVLDYLDIEGKDNSNMEGSI